MSQFCIKSAKGQISVMTITGRDEWALKQLLRAGTQGCTPIDNPAPRWSGYVHNLRNMGIDIETVTEPHGGDFPGHHARYVLRSIIEPMEGSDVEAA